MSLHNKVIEAAAGSGKTRYLVAQAIALSQKGKSVLLTTYTRTNKKELEERIIKQEGRIPPKITIKTWFAFLLENGARPFCHPMIPFRISGIYFDKGRPKITRARKDTPYYYCDKQNRVHSGRLAELTMYCNQTSKQAVFDRISNIFDAVLVDEIQDMAGYDYDVLVQLMNACSTTIMVGDPRQKTYVTNSSPKNKQCTTFFDYAKKKGKINIDTTTLCYSYRCPQEILDVANKLFPQFPPTRSAADSSSTTAQEARIHIVPKKLVHSYICRTEPMQLRWNKRTLVDPSAQVMNMGESKGLTFDHVLIYPTAPMEDWLAKENENKNLKEGAAAKLYVALTRAKYSVGIVSDKIRSKHYTIWQSKQRGSINSSDRSRN